MSKIHELKIEDKYLDRILDGTKSFEIRFNDRDFQKGDEIFFRPISDKEGVLMAKITYVLNFPEGLKEGYVGLGIKVTQKNKDNFTKTLKLLGD